MTRRLLNDRFSIQQTLGGGGFAHTYLGVDHHKLDRPCVIKQLHLTDPVAQQLFEREAKQLDEIGKHPHIPALFAYFQENGYYYLVEEYLPGMSLGELIVQKGSFSEEEVRGFLAVILPVIDFLHGRQLIHRDIKPDNVMFSEGTYHLIDFGAVKRLASQTSTAGSHATIISSAGYTPPEQYHGQASYPADIFSLGATCVEMLTGRQPGTMYDASSQTWRWRQCASGTLSREFCATIDRMIQPSVQARFQSARDVMDALASGGVGQRTGMTAQTVPVVPKAGVQSAPQKRTGTPAFVVVALLVLAMVGGAAGFAGFVMRPGEQQVADPAPRSVEQRETQPSAVPAASDHRPATSPVRNTPARSEAATTPRQTIVPQPSWEQVGRIELPHSVTLLQVLDDGRLLYVTQGGVSGTAIIIYGLDGNIQHTRVLQHAPGQVKLVGSLLHVQDLGAPSNVTTFNVHTFKQERRADPVLPLTQASGTRSIVDERFVPASHSGTDTTATASFDGTLHVSQSGERTVLSTTEPLVYPKFSDSGNYLWAQSDRPSDGTTVFIWRRSR